MKLINHLILPLFYFYFIQCQTSGIIAMLKTNVTSYQVQKSNTCYNFKSIETLNSLFVPTDNLVLNFFNQCDCSGEVKLTGYTGYHKYDSIGIKSFKLQFFIPGCKVM
ncbi:hypothetical protein K502DRAFT_349880 [Neoconidiobolus thromboides FSU 785]|nr:hypothetical protein K502DRAFT_349880 [Neoconidiobolus thromboides FSU 785]